MFEVTKIFLDEHMVFIDQFLISATKLSRLRCGQYVQIVLIFSNKTKFFILSMLYSNVFYESHTNKTFGLYLSHNSMVNIAEEKEIFNIVHDMYI